MPGSAGSRNNSAGSGECQCQETSTVIQGVSKIRSDLKLFIS